MKRRALLSLVSGSALTLAGCTGTLSGGSTSDPTEEATATATETRTATETATATQTATETATPTDGCETTRASTSADPTTDAPGEGWPRVAVEPMPSPYEEAALDAFVTRQFDDESPAAIRVTYTNVTCDSRDVRFGANAPFSRIFSDGTVAADEYRKNLYLVPHGFNSNVSFSDDQTLEGGVPVSKQDGCWTAEPGKYGAGTVEAVGAGATIGETYSIFNDPDNKSCLPAGDYDYTMENYNDRGEPWGFTLSLSY